MLAFSIGVRNASVRHLGVRDMTPPVLTTTLTGLASQSMLAGSHNPKAENRVTSVLSMLVGATLVLHASAGWELAVAASIVACTIAFFARRAPLGLGLAS